MKYNTLLLSTLSYFGILSIIFSLSSCGDDIVQIEIDNQKLEKIYRSDVSHSKILNKDIDLYVDYSTCVIDAVKNSPYFKSLRPKITGESPTLYAIKGPLIEAVSSDMDTVNQKLTNLTEIPYANIVGAIDKISNSDGQSILITDGEYWTNPEGERTDLPYMRESLEKWLNRGYVVQIVIEDYKESYKGKSIDKKRFYFFFTDDKLENNIYDIALKAQGGNSTDLHHFKMTNSDIQVFQSATVDDNLQFDVDTTQNYDIVDISSPWSDIEEYVLNANDDQGNALKNGNPFLKNIKVNSKKIENYNINQTEIKAYNITDFYLEEKNAKINEISEGFKIDEKLLKEKNIISIRITDKLLSNLKSDKENLLRLDIILKEANNKPIDEKWFTWRSLSKPNVDNVSVFESIKQTFDNPAINAQNRNKGIIHTIFIKTLEYN
jgi:hypothetical protein